MPFHSSARGSFGPQGKRVIKGPLAPVWTTFSPGAVGTAAFSYTFVATDDSGDTPTYSVASGSLPNGLTLNSSTGVLSGTATVSGTFTYTLRATDVNGRFTDTTSISQVVALALYTFTSATFGSGGAAGPNGPNISQARSALGNPSWANTYLDMTTNGIQRWTVPATGSYEIICAGARGGGFNSSAARYGTGAVITATHNLTQGEVIQIVVGQVGRNGNQYNSGGGGGTYVYRNATDTFPIMAAGGGGGGSSGGNWGQRDANTGTASRNGGNSGGGDAGGGNSSGNGGDSGSSYSYQAGGGAGWLSNGGRGHNSCGYPREIGGQDVAGGLAPRNGATGGNGYTNADSVYLSGGFGGGGGGSGACGSSGAGGGGGYSGGGVGYDCCSSEGGGGGSYSATTITSSSVSNTGNGYVTITRL
jgi:hypothetical protein